MTNFFNFKFVHFLVNLGKLILAAFKNTLKNLQKFKTKKFSKNGKNLYAVYYGTKEFGNP